MSDNIAWEQAWQLLLDDSKKLVFITGPAGTGKSNILSKFVEFSRNSAQHHSNIAVVAPTGVAAINAGGMTVHKFFNFPIDVNVQKIETKDIRPYRREQYDVFRHLDHLLIDEASMLRADLLDCIDVYLRMYGKDAHLPFGGIKLTFIGDFYQLEPVIPQAEAAFFAKEYKSAFFFDAKALHKAPLHKVELTKIYRQVDPSFQNLLNRLRTAQHTEADLDILNQRHRKNLPYEQVIEQQQKSIYLTSHRKRAQFINSRELQKLDGETQQFQGSVQGKFPTNLFPSDECLELKLNSRVMMLNNEPNFGWFNGSIGKVTKFSKPSIPEPYIEVMLDSGKQVRVHRHSWDMLSIKYIKDRLQSESIGSFKQFPLKLAWACTIHKAQGLTFENVIIDLSTGVFSPGQVYVALSRCTNLTGIVLTEKLNSRQIFCNNAMDRLQKSMASL